MMIIINTVFLILFHCIHFNYIMLTLLVMSIFRYLNTILLFYCFSLLAIC